MKRVAILRCEKLPSFVNWEIPNLDELFEEDDLLIHGFQAQGVHAQPVVWNDPDTDWDRFDVALIRSTWDYLDDQEKFLHVLSQIESSSCRLYNPLEAVHWNIDKHYLFDLERWEVPIIPTYPVSTLEVETLQELLADRQYQTIILKPTIGLGASYSHRVPLAELGNTLTRLKAGHPHNEYLVQPFVEGITSEGEWSFVYFNRQISHVLLKKPAPDDYRVQGIYGGTVQPAEPGPDDLLQAEAVINRIPFDNLYVRLDFVRVEGILSVIEVELIEPIFYFNLVPQSIDRLVHATRVRFATNP